MKTLIAEKCADGWYVQVITTHHTRKAYLVGVEASARAIERLGQAHPQGFTLQQVIASSDSLVAANPIGKKYPNLLK